LISRIPLLIASRPASLAFEYSPLLTKSFKSSSSAGANLIHLVVFVVVPP
jgi:hypothetical protein